MSALNKIACFQGRRDEAPNQELARELADQNDARGAREIAENLWNKDKNIQSDCLKVLYETGYLKPALVSPFVDDFLKLLDSRNNRLVWGSLIALSTIASLQPGKIYEARERIIKLGRTGSVITVDNAVKTLSIVAAAKPSCRAELLPFLLDILKTCIPRDVPRHAENVLLAVDGASARELIGILESRMPEMIPSRLARMRKIIREAQKK
jgi:hypothetical protein